MTSSLDLEDLYKLVDRSYHPVIDYVIGLNIADRLSEEQTRYDVKKTIQSYLISIKKENSFELNFFINYYNKRIDIEGFMQLPYNSVKEFQRSLLKTDLNINKNLSVYDHQMRYFCIVVDNAPSFEDMVKLKEIIQI